jgi:hypothetical protein
MLELRKELEGRLRDNKYYVAITKLDEIITVIKRLESVEGENAQAGSSRECFSSARQLCMVSEHPGGVTAHSSS